MPDLMPIGRFSRACRLSIKALRHYDELGLLRPAFIDPRSAYRYYGREQAPTAIAMAAPFESRSWHREASFGRGDCSLPRGEGQVPPPPCDGRVRGRDAASAATARTFPTANTTNAGQ
jgi:MerR family regulatory protein